MMKKHSILLLFVSLILISLCVSTVVAADTTDNSVDDTTIQQDVVKTVETTQKTDALKKSTEITNTKTDSNNTYYVATNGKSSNTGTESSPFDLSTGVAQLQRNRNGNLIIKGGTYKISETIKLYEGTYTLTGKSGQTVIFDAQKKVRHLYLGTNTNVEIKNIVFTNGKASDMGNTGGAIRADAGGKIVITNNTFKQNYAPTYGGAIANSAENAEISNNIFIGNIADTSGGAVCTTAKSTQIIKNTFEQNKGGRNGGSVYISGAGTLVKNNKFTKNFSNQTAAGVFTNTQDVTISNNVFKENTAYRTGAAVYDEGSKVKVLNNEFTANTVKAMGGIGDGAGAYIRGAEATVQGNTFTDNKAEGSGGALYLDTGGKSTASQNVFTTNKADKNGGAIFTRGNNNKILNNTFIMNIASGSLKPAIKDYGTNTVISDNKNADTSIYNGTVYNVGNYVTISKNIFEDKKPVVKTATIVTVSQVSATIGDNMTLTANVKGIDGKAVTGGNIVFKLNGKTVSSKVSVKNGVGTASITAIKSYDNANLTASYSGSSNYLANKTKSPAKVTVNFKDATLSLTVSPKSQKQYETIKFTVKVTDTMTGAAPTNNDKAYVIFKVNGVTLKDGNSTLKVKVNNGVATYNYVVPKGMAAYTGDNKLREYTVNASFYHPDYNTPTQPVAKFTLQRSDVTITTTKLVVDMNSRKLIVQGNIKDYKNNNVVGTNKLNIKINGVSLKINGLTTVDIKDGVINLAIDLPNTITTFDGVKNITFVTGLRTSYNSCRVTTTNFTKA